MVRPRKWRKVCCMPGKNRFGPLDDSNENCFVSMTLEEYETIRLIDYEGFTQERCAMQMKVARTTVQAIYSEARKKLARVLVEGKKLYIIGGNYQLCEGNEDFCECGGCYKHRQHRQLVSQAKKEVGGTKGRSEREMGSRNME